MKPKTVSTETTTRYYDEDGDLLASVRRRTDTGQWTLSDFTGPSLKWRDFDNRKAAEAAAKERVQ
jgi:hypothetical protein